MAEDFSEKEGVTEKLKAENMMLWVQRMNNIHNRAMEIVPDRGRGGKISVFCRQKSFLPTTQTPFITGKYTAPEQKLLANSAGYDIIVRSKVLDLSKFI